jgi:hypothetical protein
VVVTSSLLAPLMHPRGFDAQPNLGGTGGARGGYRFNDIASFEGGFEYGNVKVRASDGAGSYRVESMRFGPSLRLMTTGARARLYGTIGGGGVYDWLHVESASGAAKHEGFTAYVQTELGFELSFGGVLAGVAGQALFQSSRGLDGEPFESDTIVWVGGGLRVGYAFW